ncbi:MAG: glycosyltransferase family 39 protein [Candidatus Eisenbacteria bacterium]|nr:glycosyltransferase family 39 protein [Candidatus Eisenbacteria bacterium]
MRVSWIAIAALGVGVRLLFLLLAPHIEPHADESTYLYLAACWNRFGVYSDWVRFLWPPGYPFFLSLFLRAAGGGGVLAAKAVQVLLSGVIGASVYRLGLRFFDRRAARAALWVWALYPPLIGYTHTLWPETLFLALFFSAFALIAGPNVAPAPGARGDVRLLLGGFLFGGALLVKEGALPLVAVILLWLFLREGAGRRGAGARGAALTALAVLVVILPWTIRNHSVYGRWQPVGATLGMNCYVGLNGTYRNLDYPSDMIADMVRANRRVAGPFLGSPPPAWKRSEAMNIIDRSREDTAAGIRFARANPGYVLRSRVKRIADYLSPTSNPVRHYALRLYPGILSAGPVRRAFVLFALFASAAVTALAVPGIFHAVRRRDGWILALLPAALFLTAGLLVGASRFRVPVLPVLIVLAGRTLAGGEGRLRAAERWTIAAAWAALLFFWVLNSAELLVLLRRVW